MNLAKAKRSALRARHPGMGARPTRALRIRAIIFSTSRAGSYEGKFRTLSTNGTSSRFRSVSLAPAIRVAKKDCRLIFCCFEEGCNLSLGLECACYNHTFVKYQSHDHSLALVEKASCDDIHCEACRKSYKKLSDDQILVPKEVDRTRSLLFRCMECSHNLHFLCGPLPLRIKYEYHIHPLTLVDHSTVEDTGSDEFYCDACEEERDQNLRFYYCADCKYYAHIHCVLTEVLLINYLNFCKLYLI